MRAVMMPKYPPALIALTFLSKKPELSFKYLSTEDLGIGTGHTNRQHHERRCKKEEQSRQANRFAEGADATETQGAFVNAVQWIPLIRSCKLTKRRS